MTEVTKFRIFFYKTGLIQCYEGYSKKKPTQLNGFLKIKVR